MRQLENQKFDDYLLQVEAQAKNCEFGELEDSLVKEMIVLGTRSNSVRVLLFTEKDLELGKAVTICRTGEQAHEQVQEMNAESRDEAAVAAMDANGRRFEQGRIDQPQNTEQQRQTARSRHEKTEKFYCSRCATEHGQRQCTAFGKQCKRCDTYGHFSRVCPKQSTESKQPRVNTMDDDEQDEECPTKVWDGNSKR
jgi:hypothetical protein